MSGGGLLGTDGIRCTKNLAALWLHTVLAVYVYYIGWVASSMYMYSHIYLQAPIYPTECPFQPFIGMVYRSRLCYSIQWNPAKTLYHNIYVFFFLTWESMCNAWPIQTYNANTLRNGSHNSSENGALGWGYMVSFPVQGVMLWKCHSVL